MTEEGGDKPGVSLDGKIVITDLFGAGRAVEKLSPTLGKLVDAFRAGVGKVAEPGLLYLNSRAENAAGRHNALADAKAYLDLDTRSPAVLQAMRERLLGIEYRREVNIQQAQLEAAQIAQSNPSSHVHDVDPDFYVEWMEGVKDVSNEQLRSAWAKLMADAPMEVEGRVEKPVVDFLRQLDPELAGVMKRLYEDCTLTEGVIPLGLADLDEVAEEVGIARIIDSTGIQIMDGLIGIAAMEGHFQVAEIGARAERLSELVFGEIDPVPLVEPFVKNLDAWIADLVRHSSHLNGRISIRVAGVTTVFDFQSHLGELVYVVTDFARHHADYVLTIPFEKGNPQHMALKEALLAMGKEKLLKYVSQFPTHEKEFQ